MMTLAVLACQLSFVIPEKASAEENMKTFIIYTEPVYSDSIYLDSGYGLDTLVLPASVSGYDISWTSSDETVASVDSRGRIHGRLTGENAGKDQAECFVTATVTWNGKTAEDTVKVIVKPYPGLAGSAAQNDSGSAADSVEGQAIAVFRGSTGNKAIRSAISGKDCECGGIIKEDKHKIALVDAEDSGALDEAVESLENDERVIYTQPNYIYKTEDAGVYPGAGQSHHDAVNSGEAWDLLYENGVTHSTRVGVIDSGVEPSHPDLTQSLILDEEGQYTAFSYGSRIMRTKDYNDGHGTHVAGIIGADYDDGDAVAGIASGRDNDLSDIEVVGAGPAINTYDVILAIHHAADRGAEVINLSLGSEVSDSALAEAILDRYYNDNILFVTSAGNIDTSQEQSIIDDGGYQMYAFPSDMKEVISVTCVDGEGKRWYTESGTAKDVAAPGKDILSTVPVSSKADGFGRKSGTSMSCPVITGIAALVLDARPDLKPWEVRNIICATSGDESGYCAENELGYGYADAGKAVQAAYDSLTPDPDAPLSISIKGRSDGEPMDTLIALDTNRYEKAVKTESKISVSKPSSVKVTSKNGKIKVSFKKAVSTVTTDTETTISDKYTGGSEVFRSTSTSASRAGVRYLVKIKRTGAGTGFYRYMAKTKKRSSWSVAVSGSTVRSAFRKAGKVKLKKGKVYTVTIRAYKKAGDKTVYSKSSGFKVKIKK